MKRKIFIMIIVLMSMSQMTAQNKILKEESNGTKWYLISHNGVYGIEDATGKVIAPLSAGYDSVFYFSFRTDFGLQKNKNYPVWGARKVINGVPMRYVIIISVQQALGIALFSQASQIFRSQFCIPNQKAGSRKSSIRKLLRTTLQHKRIIIKVWLFALITRVSPTMIS